MRIQLLSFLSIISIWLVACTPTPSANIIIDGVIYDGYELANGDELVILRNMGTVEVDLGGWQLTDRDSGTAVIPPNTRLAPQTVIWLTKNGSSFSQRYHHVVDFELEDSHTLIDNLQGSWPGFTDDGDEIILLDANGTLVDMLVFKSGDSVQDGWAGTAVTPIYVEEEGIFLHRLRQDNTDIPQPDTNTAADWTQNTTYAFDGRPVGAPSRVGSNLERLPQPQN